MELQFVKPERLWLKDETPFDEKWVQARIATDPSLLGIGDVYLLDRERKQPRAGRLDLLLQDSEYDRRYEVEIQLGATDESHIIRTIEYWDLERKRYPQYDHCAVIVAEDITARFLNVVSLFNGTIPLIALQMSALKFDDKVTLVFTKVLDEMARGPVDEDEEVYEEADRGYWEQRATKNTVALCDELLKLVKALDPGLELKYNKGYIGLAKAGQTFNFVQFRPRQKVVLIEPRLDRADDHDKLLAGADLELLSYDKRWNRYRLRVTPEVLKRHHETLAELFRRAFIAFGR